MRTHPPRTVMVRLPCSALLLVYQEEVQGNVRVAQEANHSDYRKKREVNAWRIANQVGEPERR
jgi:hypothetical protein